MHSGCHYAINSLKCEKEYTMIDTLARESNFNMTFGAESKRWSMTTIDRARLRASFPYIRILMIAAARFFSFEEEKSEEIILPVKCANEIINKFLSYLKKKIFDRKKFLVNLKIE